MTDNIIEYFPENEVENRKKIFSLMKDWKKEITKKDKILFIDDNIKYPPEDYFYLDGFFPGYYNQTPKVLFIAREARWTSGQDFIENSLKYFKRDAKINNVLFWSRIFYMLYGIRTKGKFEYKDIPYPYDYVKEELDIDNNYGFALMNISKYSNDREDGGKKADWDLINQFLKDSNLNERNIFKEELEILDPDVIITANLWCGNINENYLNICFNEVKPIKSIEGANLSTMTLNKKLVKIIDTYHFSMPGSPKDYFYDPVIELLFKITEISPTVA